MDRVYHELNAGAVFFICSVNQTCLSQLSTNLRTKTSLLYVLSQAISRHAQPERSS